MKKKIIFVIVLLSFCLTLAACSTKKSNSENQIQGLSDINGKPMGCMSGSIFDKLIEEKFPNSSITYYNSRSDLLLGLKSGKIAGYIADDPVAMMVVAQNDDITYLDEPVGYVDYGICFSRDKIAVRDEFNAFLNEIKSSGHLKELQEKWICEEGTNQVREEVKLTGEKGKLTCATTPDAAPFSFLKNDVFQGYEVELLYEFAAKNGYDIQIETLSFDGLLTAVSTGKYDLGFNGIYITEERSKSVNFSTPTYRADDVVVISQANAKTSGNIFEKFKTSVYKNFIEEDRYKLILQGLGTTVLISLAAVIFGTILAFVEYLLSLAFKVCRKIFDLLQKLLGGLPIMIILMLLFYVVFNKSALSGTVVSIIGFSLMFSGVTYDLLKSGVAAIDSGQMEAAIALGYGKWKALFRIVLPQAVSVMRSAYERDIVSMVKLTSVVGYVSVSDLARMSDIIRGRTYDALLPLVVVAILYFAVCALFVKIVDWFLKKTMMGDEDK